MATFSFRIRIDSINVPGADKVNFPYNFNHNVPDIPAEFWANISDPGAFDVRFYEDELLTIEYKREIGYYISFSQEISAWVQIPILKGAGGSGGITELYCEVDNGTKPNDTDVWDDIQAQAVFHFNGNANDSTGNANDSTLFNTPPYVAGKIGKCLSFDGSIQFAQLANDWIWEDTVVAEAWIYLNSYPAVFPTPNEEFYTICCKTFYCTGYRGRNEFDFCIDENGKPTLRIKYSTNCSAGSQTQWYKSDSVIPLGTWVHVAIRSQNHQSLQGFNRFVDFFVNGALTTKTVFYPGNFTVAWPFAMFPETQIGAAHINMSGSPIGQKYHFDGLLEEVRMYKHAISLFDNDWFSVVFENVENADTFSTAAPDLDPIPFEIFLKISAFGMVVLPDTGEFDPVLTASLGWFEGEALEDDIITDHSARAQNLLIEQFEEATVLKRILAIYVEEIQEIEYVLSEIIKSRNLDLASGAQLNILGERVGEDRNFRTDGEYRAAIQFRIFLNSSNGEPETLIEALKVIAKADTVNYAEPYPATVLLSFTTPFTPPSNLLQQIEAIAVAGVKILLQYTDTNDLVFAFDGEDGLPPAPGTAGFGDGTPTAGGQFSELIS